MIAREPNVIPAAAIRRNPGLRPAAAGRATARGLRRGAFLMTEVVVAMAILALALFPLSYAVWHERQLSRACYYRAVAMEIVDGELEVLSAGAWRAFDEGSHPYSVRAESAKNLPPGRFALTRTGNQLRLEWRPDQRDRGGRVLREATLR